MKELKVGDTCLVCGVGTLVLHKKDVTLRYQEHTTQLLDLEVLRCSECEEGFYRSASERRYNRAFSDLRRSVDGLLTSDEIKKIREKYGLTQEQLSLLMGMALKTVARYENGTIVQNASTDLLLRLIGDYEIVVTALSQYTSVPLSSHWKEQNTRLFHLRDYHKLSPLELLQREKLGVGHTFKPESAPHAA